MNCTEIILDKLDTPILSQPQNKTRHRQLRLLPSFILIHRTVRHVVLQLYSGYQDSAQLYTYFQQFLQLEGARGKLKGYQTDQMGKQA
jgi:hypothetical protein